jgi:hypothetical protein
MMAIRQKRNGEIEVTQEIPIPVSQHKFHNIKLKVSTSRRSWINLYNLSFEKEERLGKLIYLNFVEPAFSFIKPGPRFRGINRGREVFVLRMKERIPPIYYWIFWWLKEPPGNWPAGLKELVKETKDYCMVGKRPPNAADVTAYLCEKYYGKKRKENGLSGWIIDPDQFRRTFISNSEVAKVYKNKPKEYFLKAPNLPHPKDI